MEEDLRDHLISQAGLSGLIGDRMEWSARPEESPSVAGYFVDGPPDYSLKGSTGLIQSRVQFDCWGASFLAAKAVGEALIAALPAYGAVVGSTKFQSCIVLDTERGRFGEAPNILHRTRIDVRVNFSPA